MLGDSRRDFYSFILLTKLEIRLEVDCMGDLLNPVLREFNIAYVFKSWKLSFIFLISHEASNSMASFL